METSTAASDGSGAGAIIHVSPDGDDAGDGSARAPVATLHRAHEMLRGLPREVRERGVVVELGDGIHRLERPLVLDERDSGTPGAPLRFRAASGARPVVSGGVTLGPWRDCGDGTWATPVGDLETRQLFVDGQRLGRTRRRPPPGMVRTDDGYRLPDAEMFATRNPTDVEMVYDVNWTQMRGCVAATDGRSIVMDQPWFANARWHPMAMVDIPNWIENLFELVPSQPGTWYLDRSAGQLFVHPPPGTDLATAEVVAPALTTLVDVRGSTKEPVHDIRIEGITFSHTTWPMRFGDERGLAALQANLALTGERSPWSESASPRWHGSMMPAALAASAMRRLHVEGCRFTRLGAAGLELGPGCQDSTVIGNRFDDISGTGIQIGNGEDHDADADTVVRDIRVANNRVHDVAVEYQGGVGIWAGYVASTTIDHNHLSDLPYTGISLGWGWGALDPTIMRDNAVLANRVERPMQVLLDGGGIYVLSAQPGMRIAGNVVTEQPTVSGAIYLDDGCRFVTVEHNVVLDSGPREPVWIRLHDETVELEGEWGSFLFKGRDHVIRENWWDRENEGCWSYFEGGTVGTNHQISSAEEVPRALFEGAGIEPAYADAPVVG